MPQRYVSSREGRNKRFCEVVCPILEESSLKPRLTPRLPWVNMRKACRDLPRTGPAPAQANHIPCGGVLWWVGVCLGSGCALRSEAAMTSTSTLGSPAVSFAGGTPGDGRVRTARTNCTSDGKHGLLRLTLGSVCGGCPAYPQWFQHAEEHVPSPRCVRLDLNRCAAEA